MADGMRSRLETRLAYLGAARGQVIDSVLAELGDPTPFMLEAGAMAIEEEPLAPIKSRVKWAFQAMLSEARKDGE